MKNCFKIEVEWHGDNCTDKKGPLLIVRTPLDHYEPDSLVQAIKIIKQDFQKCVDAEVEK